MIDAIIHKYGLKSGLSISGESIQDWPYDEKKPTKAQLKIIVSDYKPIEAKERADTEEKVILLKDLVKVIKKLRARIKVLEDK